MALRFNHYDAAFEAFLRQQRRPYVAVDEARRALCADASLKSFDFIVYSEAGSNLLVDVKGRRCATPAAPRSLRWDSWTSQEDPQALLRWQQIFGGAFRSLFVFAYDLLDSPPDEHRCVWEFRRRTYAFYGVWADDYAGVMRRRSESWDTVSLRQAEFDQLRRPLCDLL